MAGDLAQLLQPPPPSGVGYKQGVVLTWDNTDASNTVLIDSAVFEDLPILNGSEALLLYPGAVVGILTTGTTSSSWFIMGRITIPRSPDAVATLGAGVKVASVISNSGPITNDTLALNGGPQIPTTILATGRAFVSGSSGMDLDVGEGAELRIVGSGPEGATWVSDSRLLGNNRLTDTSLGGTVTISASTSDMATGLIPGPWTFELQSMRLNGAGSPQLFSRVLTVQPT